jgi:glyoxylase-like metal-dependent hydrolase (beta-lactamase superfamily II)
VPTNRRNFLKATAAGVAALSRVRAQGASGNLTSTPLADNLFLIGGAGANVVARTGSEGVVLVDGGSAEHAAALARTLAALPGGGRVRTLFNTHWHPEQTGSNLALRHAGAAILAHENTRLWMTTDVTRPWETRTFPPSPKEALPTRTFYEKESLSFDGETIQTGYLLQAHTDGDIYVYFPQANVLAIGDIISGEGWPFIDWWTGGWINGIVSGLDTLLKVANQQTRVIAGQGSVLTRADLDAQHKMFSTLAMRLRNIMYKGKNPDDAIAEQPTKEFDAQMGDPKFFIRRAFESMWGHFTPDA